jgi:hypothetical protein
MLGIIMGYTFMLNLPLDIAILTNIQENTHA